MTKRKYCYEFTEYRQYKCSKCGRTMHKPIPHYCNGQYRKHNLKFVKMKQFNLNEYLKDPSKKVITRDGRPVIIHCTNYVGLFPIVAEIEGSEYSMTFNKDGKYDWPLTSNCDLFFAEEE